MVRLAAGVALGGRPDTFLRWEPPGRDGSWSSSLMLRTIGRRGLVSAAVAAPMVLLDAWALSR